MSRNIQNNQSNTIEFIHITDSHLLDHPEDEFHGLNTRSCLDAVLSQSLSRYPDVDFLLFTGDISQTGNEQSYNIFRSVIQQYDFPMYCVPGNHDSPELLQAIIPDCPDKTINIIPFEAFSLVLINSRVEGQNYGIVSHQCLQQLKEHLANHQSQLTIVAVHHPPILTNCKWLDDLGLQNQNEFLQVINDYNPNTLVLSGHIHQEVDSLLEQLRILTTPSTCYQFEVNCDHMIRANLPPAYRHIRLDTLNNIDTKVHYIDQEENERDMNTQTWVSK